MVRIRWQRTPRFIWGFLLMGLISISAMAQEDVSDLAISDLAIGPSSSVVRGSLVRVEALLTLSGAPLTGNIRVEIAWRRLDKQEPCGTTWETVASDASLLSSRVEAWIDTSDLIAGTYEITVTADPDNWIPEISEINNRLATSLDIRPPQPELHPTRLETIPATPLAWGETVTLKTEIENSGDLAAGAFHVTFALLPLSCVDPSTGKRWDISPIIGQSGIGNWVFNLVSAPRSATEATSAVPADAWIPFTRLQVPGLARDQAIELSGVLGTGDWLRQQLTTPVSESGTIDGSTMLPFSIDDMVRLETCVTTYAIRVTITHLVGTAEQDETNNFLQSALSVEPSTLELPELLPIQAIFDEDLPLAWDDDVDVEVLVTNRGGSAAPAVLGATSITVSFSYRAQGATAWIPLEIQTIAQLGAEEDSNTESVDITIDARPSQLALDPGAYELRIAVDEANLIQERNEYNNEMIVGFSVQGTELHPVTLDLPAEPVHQGDTITVVALVENTGERSQRDFTVGFYIDDMRFDTFYYQAVAATEDGLEEDDRARVQGILDTTDLPPQTYAIRVVVDPDNHILELDEGNNVIQSSLRLLSPIQRLAELHITELSLLPTSPVPEGSSLRLAAAIRNDGSIAAERFNVSFDLAFSSDGVTWTTPQLPAPRDDDEFDTTPFQRIQPVYGLARSEKVVVGESFDTSGWPIGQYRLSITVDPTRDGRGEIAEMDETNNEAITLFMIGEAALPTHDPQQPADLPNLVFQNVIVSPSGGVGIGSTVQFSAQVVNIGVQPSDAFQLLLQWTTPTGASYTLLSQRIDGLSPGEAWTIPPVSVQASLPMGPYAIIGLLDAGNEIPESNESDNELLVSIPVGTGEGIQPDLIPIAVRFAPATSVVEAGQEVLVYTTIQNVGALAAGAFTVTVAAGESASTETWPGLDPLQSIELAHSLGTPAAGSYTVTIRVDSSDQVVESDESNNEVSHALQIAALEEIAATHVASGVGSVQHMTLDHASGTVTAAWSSGAIQAFDHTGASRLVYDINEGISSMDVVYGIQDIAYIGTPSGSLHAVDINTGALLLASEPLGIRIERVLIAGGERYASTASTLMRLDGALRVIDEVALDGTFVDVAYDPSRETLYVITSRGLTSFDRELVMRCSVSSFIGTPSALALGSAGVYIGTSSGMVHAMTHCQPVADSTLRMLDAWRFPRTSVLSGAVESIVVDERDIDPIYASTSDGTVASIDFNGGLLWTYQRSTSSIQAKPTVDARSGRFFYADSLGMPVILNSNGDPAFAINADASVNAAATANVLIDEVRKQTANGSRLVRVYYYGTADGRIFKVESTR